MCFSQTSRSFTHNSGAQRENFGFVILPTTLIGTSPREKFAVDDIEVAFSSLSVLGGPTDGPTDESTYQWVYRWTDGRTDL